MPKSIKQNLPREALPNFRSLGVILRTLILINGLGMLQVLSRANSWQEVVPQLAHGAALLQPVLLSCLLLLYFLNGWLARLPYRHGYWTVLLLISLVASTIAYLGRGWYLSPFERVDFSLWRSASLAFAVAVILLTYLRWRTIILSPALYRARLQALQARIRPHFLFNCINTVMSMVRSDPKRAETALEDMADLFRMAMTNDHELVPLGKEIELSRRYLALEQLRLGDRLKVAWHAETLPGDALAPPLILQPLLENAVYHGIEPLPDGGLIDVRLSLRGSEIHIEVHNPLPEAHDSARVGNQLALSNIRERLSLLFDIEAQYKVESGSNFYLVHIVIPYLAEEHA